MAISRYGADIIEWTKEEVRSLGRVTRKTMTMNGALHPKGDVARVHTECDNNLGWCLDKATAKFLMDTNVLALLKLKKMSAKTSLKETY